MEYLWVNIKAACNSSKHTDHLVSVAKKDARKTSKRKTNVRTF